MSRRAAHNWELIWHYHECPECGFVFESRRDFRYRMGRYLKELECPRCGAAFTLKKEGGVPLGPIFSEGAEQETNWIG